MAVTGLQPPPGRGGPAMGGGGALQPAARWRHPASGNPPTPR